jgi:hypothetical protein
MCISISPEAFNALVFCPALAKAFNTTVNKLPTSCGNSAGLDMKGVTVTSITDSFATNYIDINGTATKSGTCYDAYATFHATLKLSMSGSVLTPAVAMDQPDVTLDIPWYCQVAAAIFMGPIGLALAAVAESVGPGIAEALASKALTQALGSGLQGVDTGGLSAGQFKSVKIATDGVTLQGTVPFPTFPSYESPALDLSGSVTTTDKTVVDSGIYHAKVWCMLQAKDYPYTEYSQKQQGTYSLTSKYLQLPLTPSYTINPNMGPEVPLTGASGTLEIPNVETHYPMPLATAGTKVIQTVHIDYQINGNNIKVSNRPEEGCYAVWLNVSVSGCSGPTIVDEFGHPMISWTHVQFEGDHVDVGGSYTADVSYCAGQLAKMVQKISQEYKKWQEAPIWVQVNYPAPEQLVTYVRDLIALGLPEMDEVLRTIKIAHGNSFFRAMLSPFATQPSLLNAGKAIKAPANAKPSAL